MQLPVHPHLVFELVAYTVGFQLFRFLRRREGDPVGDPMARAWTMAGGVIGAVLGAKALFWIEDPAVTLERWTDPLWLLGGRSIVGALLGGLAGVELSKRFLGLRMATGDAYAVPLCVGIAIGRVGCFLTGVEDGTHGIETTLPWGVDHGDGLRRHPTALYEIGVLLGLAAVLQRWRPVVVGDRFKAFMVAYLLWRLGVELVKTQPFPWWGLSGVQVACVAGLLYYAVVFVRRTTTSTAR